MGLARIRSPVVRRGIIVCIVPPLFVLALVWGAVEGMVKTTEELICASVGAWRGRQ